jgi:hypothetical protein
MIRSDPAIQWLLQSTDPSIRYLMLTDLLDISPRSREARAARAEIPDSARVRALLAGQGAAARHPGRSFATHPGGFGVHPYKKWNGAHWRLVSLVELGVTGKPEGSPKTLRVLKAADQVLTWLTSDEHRARIKVINGRTRRCGSQEGNALAVCSRLGMMEDPRVQYLARSLVEWQWDDGGWNCDKNPTAHHSSFYESLAPLWGLVEWHRVTQDNAARRAADRAAEFFLRHRLFRSEKTGEVIDNAWLKLHYPLYYHYDILQALVILARAGKVRDPRAREALDIIESKRGKDGGWRAEGFYWKPRGKNTSNIDVVDWGRQGANEMITLNALRVLKAAGRVA